MASPSYHGNGPHFPSFARTSLEKDVDADLQLARKCRNGRVIWVSGLVAQTILLPCVLILWVMTVRPQYSTVVLRSLFIVLD